MAGFRPIEQTHFDVTAGAARHRHAQAQGRRLRHPEARRDAAALRPAARARRRDEELGGDARPEPRARREAACRPCRRSSDRIQQVRGHHPERRIRRRHRDDLGSRHTGRRNTTRTRAWQKGHLDFELKGEKLKGHWHLVRMRRRPGEKRENWLLIKRRRGVRARPTNRTFSRRSRCR